MPAPDARIAALVARLEKGRRLTRERFVALTPEQWRRPLYAESPWSPRELLAHFVSSEEWLLALARDVAAGGPGAPAGLDLDAFNAREQARLRAAPPEALLAALDEARGRTLAWARTLEPAQLDRTGRHPALGTVSVETMLTAIYGHQLLHMRELVAQLAAG